MSDLVSDLRELAQLHDAGALSDEEFLAAKQARIARESQAAPAGQPAPTQRGPRETCQIEVVQVEAHSVARSVWRYIAVATGPRGGYEAARTPNFKASADYWAYEYFPAQCQERTEAFNYLVQTLYGDGWEQLPYDGEHWWNKRFERLAQSGAGTSGRAQAPEEFGIFQPSDGSFSVEVPTSWVHSKQHSTFLDRWFWEGQKVGETRPNLVALRQQPGLRAFTLERLLAAAVKGRQDAKVSEVQFAGVSGKRLSYTATPRSGGAAMHEGLVFVRQSAWQLGLNCAPEEHKTYAPLFERFVESFSFGDGSPWSGNPEADISRGAVGWCTNCGSPVYRASTVCDNCGQNDVALL